MCTFSEHCLESLVFQLWWRSRRRSEVRVLTFRAGWTLQMPLSSISDRPQIPKYACKASENKTFFLSQQVYLYKIFSYLPAHHYIKNKFRKILNSFEIFAFSKSQTSNFKKLDDQNQMIFKKISLTRKTVPGLRSESTNIFCDWRINRKSTSKDSSL